MFSLIIVIVSIALVVALAVATVYYGGPVMESARVNARAGAYINQGQQLLAAAQMFRNEKSRWPADVDELVQSGYLTGAPQSVGALSPGFSLIAPAYADEPAVRIPWVTITPGVPQYWMKSVVPKKVCQSINRRVRGDDAIYAQAVVGLQVQCFGLSEPFTALIYAEALDLPSIAVTIPSADPSLHAIEKGATPTVVVPATDGTGEPIETPATPWTGLWSGTGTISLREASAGTSIWGASYTPSGTTKLIYVPVSPQPVPTPSGWTPAQQNTRQVQPEPPSPVPLVNGICPTGYTEVNGSCSGSSATVPKPSDGVCSFVRKITASTYPYAVFVATGTSQTYSTAEEAGQASMAYYYKSNNCTAQMSSYYCPSAFTGSCIVTKNANGTSGGYECPTNSGAYSKMFGSWNQMGTECPSGFTYNASSALCEKYESSKDPLDADCGPDVPPPPTACSSSSGSEPVIRVNPDGTVTLTQYYGGCGTSKSVTCTTTSTNKPGYYQPAQIGPVSCS